jgi:hypothetical protein
VLVRTRSESEQLGHGSIETTQRIRVIPFALDLKLRSLPVPTRTAAEIARMIEGQHYGFFERRSEERRRRVGEMMFDDDDFSARKLVAKRHVKVRLRTARKRPHDGDTGDLFASRARQAQALADGSLGNFAWIRAPAQFVLFDRGLQFAIVKNGASGITE